MLTIESVCLLVVLVGLMLRERPPRGKGSWVVVVLLGALAVLVSFRGLPTLIELARFGVAATVAHAVDVERRARAAVFVAVLALTWQGSEPDEFGSWPLIVAATLLMLSLPRRLPDARPSNLSEKHP